MWFTTDFVSAISLECNGRWWRLASVGLGLLLAVDWGVDAHAQGSGSNYPDLFDNFSSETANSKLDDAPVWVATTGTGVYSNYPYVDNSQQVQIPISSGLMSAFIQPWDVNLPTPDVMRWPYERTCRRPLRVEFDLLPNLVTANSTTPDGRFSVYFNASNLAQAGGNDAAPLAAVEFAWTHGATGGGTATVQMYAKGSGIGGGFTAVGPQIDVGSFTSGVSRRFRVEFAWDYFITPRNYAAGAWPPSAAKPWAYARVQYFDVASSQWVMPYAPLGSNGWVEFGTVTLSGYGLGSALKTQFDHYDWTDANHAYLPAFTHFYAAREGTGDVTWTLDNVHLYAPPQPPFSIMVNTIGYDVAGPQWVAIRPSDPQLRADPSATEIQSIAWNLYDSTGHSLRSATTSTNGDPCFKEVVDLEAWNASGIGSEGNGYTVKPLYWWRWEWSPPVTDPQVGCYVTAAINYVISGSNASYTATSDRFDLQPELHHRYLVRGQTTLGGIGADNAEQRELTTTTTFSGLAAGFADAGNENGEHRSHGLFTSGLSHVLRQRRPEMTTADVQRYIHGIEVGANFLLLEGKAENAYAASGLRLHTTDRSTDALKGHAIDPVGGSSPPNADNGHIWHEHHSRFNGGYGPTSNDTIDNKTVGNSASLEYIAALGLIDAARTLKAYDPTTAATYFTQASDTRTYLYDLSGYFGTSAYYFLSNRAQSMLDVAFYDYTGLSTDLTWATTKMTTDLSMHSPATQPKLWVLDQQLSDDYPANPPAEPLFYFVEHGIPDPSTGMTWMQAIHAIVSNWYVLNMFPPTTANPLRITRTWNLNVSHDLFYGDDTFTTKKSALDAYGTARFAQVLGRADSSYSQLVQLTVGNLNWIGGLHRGMLGKQGDPGSDLEFSNASFVNQVGARHGIQVLQGLHQWTKPTTLNGLAGRWVKDNSGTITNVDIPPFDFLRSDYPSSESFIKTDGNLLLAAETASRLLHPRLVVEAESATSSSPSPVTVASNNEFNMPTSPNRLNGGFSVFGLVANNWLEYQITPPEPVVGGTSNVYLYTILLRASNYATTSRSVTITVTPSVGGTPWAGSVGIVPTGDPNEYVVASTDPSTPIQMQSGVTHTVRLTLQGNSCSLDGFVVKSGGVVQ